MNQNCEKFREAVLSVEQQPDRETAAHLAVCPACAAWRQEAERAARLPVPAVLPPPALEHRLFTAAHAELARIRRRRFWLRSSAPFAAAAAAAAAACVIWLQPPAPVFDTTPALAELPDVFTWDVYEEASFELDQELTSRQMDFSDTVIFW